ncbi:uncharacterized protein LOC109722814 [Ananas comosus]|uniref:Uncharacterized protein LOC109722814 n=1 Tax=Ananas comosus TaxID=4615 RepID=A0A6P5GF06_ANACO|nr:uncharacterized protein LOC109722814 [Ananas comosus]
MVIEMGARKLNQQLVLFCLFLTIFGCAFKEVKAHTTTLHLRKFSHTPPDRISEEVENSSASGSVLSARTERIDPLDNFRKYNGGYNITDKHYWSSTIFTGKYGYIIAALWLVGGVVFAGFRLVVALCVTVKERRERKRLSCFAQCDFWLTTVSIFLTFLVIVASTVALVGSSRFHSRAESIKKTIVETAEEASDTIYNATETLTTMQNLTWPNSGSERSYNLNSTVGSLNEEAANIQQKAERSMHLVNKGIQILEVVTAVTVALNLIALLALIAARPLRLHRAFFSLTVVCWLLTFLFWVYFGLYFFLDKFSGDTCAALDEYRLNPQNSTLSSILPCNEKLSDDTILHDAGAEIHDIIDKVNENISQAKSAYLPGLQYVCNPFSGPPEYHYQPENCSSDTIKIGDIPQILKRYACLDSTAGSCTQGETISASDYNTILIYTTSVQNILDVFPAMERLVDCQLVEDAFSEILADQCMPLKKYAHMTWAALATLSTLMVVIVVMSTAGALHGIKSHFSDRSVKPNSESAEASEAETIETHSTAKLRFEVNRAEEVP